ncbi:transferrin-binding protein-like solute binding protein [Psychrobacter celer]|uniref:transferrin-binding protein-like solute binding protein n=1 Tax=Psychrobacter celer TaxID=306572 RepID=UPI003FD49A66
MSLNRHSISAVATAKKLKTPLKASVVILTTVILASCASDGGDSTTPKPSPTIPKDDSGTAGGSETEGSGVDTGSNAQAEAAIKAAEAKTKAAEAALKQAKAKTKAAEDALKAAEMKFGIESQKAAEASQKAIDAARSEAAEAKAAAEAARVEAVAKIEAAAQEAEGKIKAAKEAAAKEAVAKVKVAETNAKAAEARANTAEAKAKELQDLLASETAAKEAAEAEKKTAEAETKKAQDKVKTAEEKAAAAIKAVAAAKAEADKKIAALKEATASQVAVAEKEATAAKEALKTAEAQAIVAAKAAAKAAADAAAAAAKEAAAKLEAVKSASEKEITAAKKAAADAQARADKAVKDAADAQKRVEEAEAIAKSEADRADLEALRKEQAIKQAEEAKAEALKANDEAVKANKEAADSKQLAEKAKADLETAEAALAKAEKDLAEALASGGNPEALQAEVDRRQAALDTANAKAAAAQQAQAAATAAAEAQIAAAQQAAQDAKDALAASQIKNAPETAKSGVQHISIDATGLNQGMLTTTTRDFGITDETQVQARADIASGGLVSDPVSLKVSGDNDAQVADSNGFQSFDNVTKVVTASLGEQDLVYTSTYKDVGDDLRVAHIDGAAAGLLPVNGVAVVGNATQAENMPTEGSVGYTGDATYRQLGIDNDIEFGKSVFTADFVAKNVKGDLTFDNAGKIGLTADINGNQFSGTAADNAGYNTEGGFFGGDAQYLGGVYEGNGAQGTYGAKSDLQTAAEQAAIKAQTDADAANAAIAGVQAQADAAQAAAEKARADAVKAQEALAKAEENLANAGNGEDLLAAALERAAAAEAAEAAALDAATKATAAKDAAIKAQAAAEDAAIKAQQAADKAIGDAKAEANQKVAEANQQAADAKAQAADAQTRADAAEAAEAKAKAEAITAKEQAETAIAAANAKADQANQQASAAQALVQAEKQKAETAQAEADQAKSELVTAQQKLAEVEQALADALASGGGNTEALQAEVDRRQAALDAANAKAAAAQQAQTDAQAAAEAQIAAAQQATQAAADALAASQIKNAPETAKSGVQHISIDATGLNQGMLTTTTRDFGITDETQVQARADIASRGLVSDPVALQVSGDNDTAVAGSSGFNSFENTTKVVTASLGEQDLVYTSTYKDFSDDLRVAHIDGAAAGLLPVNGVAVVGNATQTANMPTEGKVGYTGDATYRETGLDKNIQFGTSVFTADFVAKNLKGDLDFGDKKIGLEATIAGNQFSGSNEGYKADGGFFGGDAQYLGGVYEGNGAQGTYGAKSDLQTAAEQAAIKAQTNADAANAAIAGVQAQAAAAKAAAEKAQADAIKAQEALAKAEENLENAGNGEDLLAAALERAAAAEAAEAAALEAAATAEAARLAAENARAAAEEAVIQAEAAAQAAIGDAKAEAAQKVAEAKQQAADAEQAQLEANARADAAETARLEAEARAKAAEDALAAAQQLPPAPNNPVVAANATVSGFQNTISGSDNSAINTNTSSNYDELNVDLIATGSKRYDSNTTTGFQLRDATDEDYGEGFKKSSLYSLPAGYLNRRFKYTSVYKNYDDQMQVGHLYGDLKTSNNGIRLDTLSNTYVQGNSTDNTDMQYMKELSQYNIDNGINDGKVNYNGVASYIGNSKSEIIGKDPIIGTSEFKVDFVDSQVDGTLSFDGSSVSQKKIKAEITGNSFAGSWNGVDTKGGFFGEDAKLLGGVYQVSGGKGTYGATKVDPSAEPVPEPKAITGVMSNTISSVSGLGTDDAIGYRQFVTDNQTFTTTTGEGEDTTPTIVEDSAVDNLPSYDKFAARLDIVKPNKFKQPAMITTVRSNDVAFDADSGFMKSKDKNVATFKNVGSIIGDIDLKYNYDSVYRNFDTQMQIGHVYGDLVKESGIGSGVKSRYTNVYVMGQATENMPTDGNVQYAGVATYMDNLHLGSGAIKDPVVNGTSTFNVDFVNDSMTGELTFAGINKNIGISANITGNTFAGSKDNIATSGGFYGDGAKFLGGIYQEAQPGNVAGTGTTPGTGTTFQGTFGAEKQ